MFPKHPMASDDYMTRVHVKKLVNGQNQNPTLAPDGSAASLIPSDFLPSSPATNATKVRPSEA